MNIYVELFCNKHLYINGINSEHSPEILIYQQDFWHTYYTDLISSLEKELSIPLLPMLHRPTLRQP